MRFEFRCSTLNGCGKVLTQELPTPKDAWVFERSNCCPCGGGLIRLKHPKERYVGGGIDWEEL